ncbi:MAG: hypothetical protein ACRC24_01615 [Vibrionaceae bacterium]
MLQTFFTNAQIHFALIAMKLDFYFQQCKAVVRNLTPTSHGKIVVMVATPSPFAQILRRPSQKYLPKQ